MVVLVFIISCQVSEKLKNGPEISQIRINVVALRNAGVLPVIDVIFTARFSNIPDCLVVLAFLI